jgi:hypothetical protein
MNIDPVADFAFGAGRFDEAEPITAGPVALLREDFDDVTTGNFMAQRNHLAVDFCADTLVADFSMDGVSEIHRGGAGGKLQHAALGRKSVDFIGSKIDFEGGEEFAGLLQFLRPLD